MTGDPRTWPELGLEEFERREACPSCGCAGGSPLEGGPGSFVGGRRFVGESLRYGDRLRAARRVLRCPRCGLRFQEWVPARELLLRLYGTTGEYRPWPPDPRRLTWGRAMSRLPASPGRILDVGANDGHFLSLLPPGWSRASLEPAGAARAASLEKVTDARYAGFLDGPSPALPPAASFDVVCLFDVAEHFRDVGAAVANLARVLAPGGTALIETGNADCLPARLFGSRWWYYDYIEHFVFFGPSTLRAVLESAGLRVDECREVVHTRMGSRFRMGADLLLKGLLACRPGPGSAGPGPGGVVVLEHPLRVYWPDHLFVVARKDAGRERPRRPAGAGPDARAGGAGPCA